VGARRVCGAKDSSALAMKRLALRPEAIPRARELRRDMTQHERKLWRGLREALPDAHFRKQVPMGIYIADFACHRAKLIIEVDGSQHGTDEGKAQDAARSAFLESEGYRVLRFWNNEVNLNLDGVLTVIAEALEGTFAENTGAQTCAAPTLRPPHTGEGTKRQSSIGVR
jgi:very-short-patch-repair endonuclease